MYFKTFALALNTEKSIRKAGFTVNSYKESATFSGTVKENISLVPKDYCFDGSIWEPIDVSDYYEKQLILARMPLLPFEGLWQLFLNSSKDDSFGSLIIIVNKFYNDLVAELQTNKNEYVRNKKVHKRLAELKNHLITQNHLNGELVISLVTPILEK